METAAEGTRNHTLFASTAALCEIVNAGSLEESTVRDAMTNAGRSAGLDDFEIERTIQSAFDKTQGVVRMIPEKPSPVVSIQVVEKTPEGAGIATDNPFGEVPPVDGANWMFDADDTVVELWGQGDEILWAEGEALMICGGMGLGKSTLAGKLLRAQLGLQDKLLDLPVTPVDKPILYLAMDRPRQLRRAMRRQFSEEEKALIAGRLLIRPGPPIMDMAIDPTLLARMAEAVGAGVVYVDSLKDAVVGLSADETAANYNRARQMLLASGVEVCELHHSRKPSADSTGGVADVYGSTWLASGAGSVILLSGEPGDLVVKFRHVKTPANEVGPWHLLLDPDKGEFTVQRCDLLVSARNTGSNGLSAEDAAKDLYDTRRPSKSQQKKAERHLSNLEAKGLLRRIEGRGGAVWFPVEQRFEEPLASGEMF
ncbi:AAA family ATPase [Mycobacterium sp. CnD-18-1]|uniref:AAA family ATPase n=1 Tax=Mycobacterium sp. CnD-18-1 TaxID=2917744 RepID=UPI001EF2ACCA|nr:AAA family ATPase [Mycobacterium sp. CnD-18-1]MCG7607143.1 AAA family ATPase [Mycobacterium sp. CnD-18-1]